MTNELVPAQQDGYALAKAIYQEIDEISFSESALDRSYARLGGMLAAFKSGGKWRELTNADGSQTFPNFDNFMSHLQMRFRKSRGQLYAYLGVAEKLLPLMTEDVLDEIGIGKAQELKRAMYQSGETITAEMVEQARNTDTTVRDLRVYLFTKLKMQGELLPNERTIDLGIIRVTVDELKEFNEACKVMSRILELPKAMPEDRKRKEIILNALRECFATHAPEVYGTQPKKETPQLAPGEVAE